MLQKTYETEVTDLVEKAKELINWSANQQNAICYVPYADESLGEIRYIKFVQSGDNWIYSLCE